MALNSYHYMNPKFLAEVQKQRLQNNNVYSSMIDTRPLNNALQNAHNLNKFKGKLGRISYFKKPNKSAIQYLVKHPNLRNQLGLEVNRKLISSRTKNGKRKTKFQVKDSITGKEASILKLVSKIRPARRKVSKQVTELQVDVRFQKSQIHKAIHYLKDIKPQEKKIQHKKAVQENNKKIADFMNPNRHQHKEKRPPYSKMPKELGDANFRKIARIYFVKQRPIPIKYRQIANIGKANHLSYTTMARLYKGYQQLENEKHCFGYKTGAPLDKYFGKTKLNIPTKYGITKVAQFNSLKNTIRRTKQIKNILRKMNLYLPKSQNKTAQTKNHIYTKKNNKFIPVTHRNVREKFENFKPLRTLDHVLGNDIKRNKIWQNNHHYIKRRYRTNAIGRQTVHIWHPNMKNTTKPTLKEYQEFQQQLKGNNLRGQNLVCREFLHRPVFAKKFYNATGIYIGGNGKFYHKHHETFGHNHYANYQYSNIKEVGTKYIIRMVQGEIRHNHNHANSKTFSKQNLSNQRIKPISLNPKINNQQKKIIRQYNSRDRN